MSVAKPLLTWSKERLQRRFVNCSTSWMISRPRRKRKPPFCLTFWPNESDCTIRSQIKKENVSHLTATVSCLVLLIFFFRNGPRIAKPFTVAELASFSDYCLIFLLSKERRKICNFPVGLDLNKVEKAQLSFCFQLSIARMSGSASRLAFKLSPAIRKTAVPM